jgi:hypothetical protein
MPVRVYRPGAGGDPFDSSLYYTKTEVDALVSGLTEYIGGYDAFADQAAHPDGVSPDIKFDPAVGGGIIQKGYSWIVTVKGSAFHGEPLHPGDFLIANKENPSLFSDWTVVNKNIDDDIVIDWREDQTATGMPGQIIDINNIPVGEIDHNQLLNYEEDEHIDWTQPRNSGESIIHPDNIPISATDQLSWCWTAARNNVNEFSQDLRSDQVGTGGTEFIIPIKCTLKAISMSSGAAETWQAQVIINGGTTSEVIVPLTIAFAATSAKFNNLNVALEEGDKVRLRKHITSGVVTRPRISAFFLEDK